MEKSLIQQLDWVNRVDIIYRAQAWNSMECVARSCGGRSVSKMHALVCAVDDGSIYMCEIKIMCRQHSRIEFIAYITHVEWQVYLL